MDAPTKYIVSRYIYIEQIGLKSNYDEKKGETRRPRHVLGNENTTEDSLEGLSKSQHEIL